MIDAPKLTYDRGIARVSWAEPAVEMTFVHIIREDRWGDEMSAELTVSTGDDGDRAVLQRGRIAMTSTRGQLNAARYLADLAPGIAWPTLISSACWRVVDAVRQGRPAILLRDAVEPAGDAP
jgi:hypothetical protein